MINKIMLSDKVSSSYANSSNYKKNQMSVRTRNEIISDTTSFCSMQKSSKNLVQKQMIPSFVQNIPLPNDLEAIAAMIKNAPKSILKVENNSKIDFAKPIESNKTMSKVNSSKEFAQATVTRHLTASEIKQIETNKLVLFLQDNENFTVILENVNKNSAKKNAQNNALLLSSINEQTKDMLTYAEPQLTGFTTDIMENLTKGETKAIESVLKFDDYEVMPVNEWLKKTKNIKPEKLKAEEKLKLISDYIGASPENKQNLKQSLFEISVNAYMNKYLKTIASATGSGNNAKNIAELEDSLPGSKNLSKIKTIIHSNDGNVREQKVNAMLLESINERAKTLYDEGLIEVRELVTKAKNGNASDLKQLLFPEESASTYDKLQANLFNNYLKNNLKIDTRKIKELADSAKSFDSAAGSAPYLATSFKKQSEEKFKTIMTPFYKATEKDDSPSELIKGNYEQIVPKVMDAYINNVLSVIPKK